jgi:hypothetical protein
MPSDSAATLDLVVGDSAEVRHGLTLDAIVIDVEGPRSPDAGVCSPQRDSAHRLPHLVSRTAIPMLWMLKKCIM